MEEQKKAFDALDLDGNGKITFQEVKDQPPGPVGCVLYWDFTRKYRDLTGKIRDFIGFHTGSMGFFPWDLPGSVIFQTAFRVFLNWKMIIFWSSYG